ncbi:hypothetical protein LLEC1_03635 [Akanthomyces lecanii]|uniref:EKC/KEOPS complex subunit BUD32 n=1 Tax=Cordyceps confragosa TaxID=2714763 RepID=A0A179I0D8_CORDF|nr:hypothetical protein LLEC1_03635 [Akanthomyces lecanii]
MTAPLSRMFKFRFLSRGATGYVFQVDDEIALKYARDEQADEFKHENDIYNILEEHEPSPCIIQSRLRLPSVNFLPFMHGGSLEARLRDNQIRDDKGKLIGIKRNEPIHKIGLWTMELATAAAWFESLGLVHGDLRPANLLLDCNDHLKLADFDCADTTGAPPWARLLGDEAGSEKGTWGHNGARTEQFAVGSIIYTMTRGFQPYEEEDLGRGAVQRLQNMDLPELEDDHLDAITHRCWTQGYGTMNALAEETKTLEGADSRQSTVLSAHHIKQTRERCRRLLDDLFDTTTG